MDATRAQPSDDLRAISVPDLELPGFPIVLTSWIAQLGQSVLGGERIAELAVADALVELVAPTDGKLVEKLVDEGDTVTVGQAVAVIRVTPDLSQSA
jgi:2-oxoglutarate dehydrogenase E2 component (dihydrolipoamide succinyltransferase)